MQKKISILHNSLSLWVTAVTQGEAVATCRSLPPSLPYQELADQWLSVTLRSHSALHSVCHAADVVCAILLLKIIFDLYFDFILVCVI